MARQRKYHTEEERRAAAKMAIRRWNEANKEKIKAARSTPEKKAATAAYQKEYRAKNKQRLDERGRKWRLANKEEIAAKRLIYKSANRATINAQERARYHATKGEKGQTPEYKARVKRNNQARPAKVRARNEIALGRKKPDICDACGGNDGGIVFDHCHTRHHARGWLCDRCNVALGCLRDDVDRLRKLIAYLERNRENTAPQLALTGI